MGKWMRIGLAAVPFLAGCNSFWNPVTTTTTTTSGGCTTNCTTASSGDFYILSVGTSPEIAGEVFTSGTLTAISGSPWSLSSAGTPYAMAINSGGSDLYVSTTSGVYVYPITNGALGTPTALDSADLTAFAIAVDGSWLVEAIQGTGSVTFNAVPLNASGGVNGTVQSESSLAATQNSPAVALGQMAVSPDGKYIFTALKSGGVEIFAFNPSAAATANPFGSTGFIVPVQNTGSSALSVAVDPSENLYYIGETDVSSASNSGAICAFLYSSIGSSPKLATSAPIATGSSAPNFILPDSAGTELYVANGAGTGTAGSIASFSVASSGSSSSLTWTITPGSTIAAGTQPISLAVDTTGAFLLDVNQVGNPGLSTYTFGTTAGSLTAQPTANTGASPQQILALP